MASTGLRPLTAAAAAPLPPPFHIWQAEAARHHDNDDKHVTLAERAEAEAKERYEQVEASKAKGLKARRRPATRMMRRPWHSTPHFCCGLQALHSHLD
eukprot:4803763-Prymnesium_polylepis.2